MFRRARVVLALPLLVLLLSAGGAGAQPSAPPLSDFIEVVRGHNATTIRRTFPAYNQGLFQTIYGAGPGIPLTSDAQRDLFANQLVTTPAGTVLDIGHVITGIEAATVNSLGAILVARQTGCDMVAAVTWSGDIGEALQQYIAGGGDPNSYFDRSAPVEDLLGDIDGYTLGKMSAAAAADGIPVDVARLLRMAYIDGFDPGLGAWTLDSERVSAFLAVLAGQEDATLEQVRPIITREVTCFAFALASAGPGGITSDAVNDNAPAFIDRYMAFLAEQLVR